MRSIITERKGGKTICRPYSMLSIITSTRYMSNTHLAIIKFMRFGVFFCVGSCVPLRPTDRLCTEKNKIRLRIDPRDLLYCKEKLCPLKSPKTLRKQSQY